MKTRTKTMLAALMLLVISCKKESNSIQSSGTNESSTQDLITDINEPNANAVRIGSQVWTTKNLNVTRYRNGDRIPQVKNATKWSALTTGAWCWYKNDSAYGAVYGKLYNWYAVNDPRGLAPEGWHIPDDAEWTTLTTYLGGEFVAGGKMKATGTVEAGTGLWKAPNTGATNSSGFTALPGSGRDYYGTFYPIPSGQGTWWSSTEDAQVARAWFRSLTYAYEGIGSYHQFKREGYSVRCVKDED